MSYCFQFTGSSFSISSDRMIDFSNDLVQAYNDSGEGSPIDVEGDYRTASAREIVDHISEEFDFELRYDDDTNVIGITCHDNRLVDFHRTLFATAAPYVDEGCYLQFVGEDGLVWRWAYVDGDMIEEGCLWPKDIVEVLLSIPLLSGVDMPRLCCKLGISSKYFRKD